MAAESEAVDQNSVDWLVGARGVRDVVQVAVGVWCLQIDRWRNRSCFNRLDSGEAGNGTCAAEKVADHALWGADRNLVADQGSSPGGPETRFFRLKPEARRSK